MTNEEFSNEFDVLYNSITSNQAPGLDEYEKSVFLTKAQDELIKSYFNPRSNKTQEGFDGNEKRQIDFSMIMRSHTYEGANNIEVIKDANLTEGLKNCTSCSQILQLFGGDGGTMTSADVLYINIHMSNLASVSTEGSEEQTFATITPFVESFFDGRDDTKSVTLDDDIFMFVNEYVEVTRGTTKRTRLTVLPINYTEYSRLMSKPYKRPLKNQAWRILGSSDDIKSVKKAELVVGYNDSLDKYVIRYVKRPRAIRLREFDDVTLDGKGTEQTCELDPILHQEILQRAVELAKAAYTGDLSNQIALGQASQTNIGMVQSSR